MLQRVLSVINWHLFCKKKKKCSQKSIKKSLKMDSKIHHHRAQWQILHSITSIHSLLNLEKRPTAKKCCRIWKLWWQNINYDGKNMLSCIRLTWLAYFTKYVGLEMVMKQKVHAFYISNVFWNKRLHLRPRSHLSLNIHTGNTTSTLYG